MYLLDLVLKTVLLVIHGIPFLFKQLSKLLVQVSKAFGLFCILLNFLILDKALLSYLLQIALTFRL